MWSRAELKRQAKADLKAFFWYGILAIVITGVLAGIVGGIFGLILFFIKLIPVIGDKIASPIETLMTGFFILVLFTGFLRYIILSVKNGQSAGIGEVFSCFRKGRFTYVAEKEFSLSAILGLWSALFVVPGIIKRYEYFMVPYLVAECPDGDDRDLFKISSEIMDGHKMNTFVLELSFIGWYLLGTLLLGLGIPVAALYHQTTMTELYLHLKDQHLQSGGGNVFASRSSGAAGQRIVSAPAISENKTAYLVGTQGSFTGARVPLQPGEEILIGSDASRCGLVISGSQVAPVHVKISFNGREFVATDYSEAGTYNLQRGRLPGGQPVRLPSGTYLQIGTSGDIFSLEK